METDCAGAHPPSRVVDHSAVPTLGIGPPAGIEQDLLDPVDVLPRRCVPDQVPAVLRDPWKVRLVPRRAVTEVLPVAIGPIARCPALRPPGDLDCIRCQAVSELEVVLCETDSGDLDALLPIENVGASVESRRRPHP